LLQIGIIWEEQHWKQKSNKQFFLTNKPKNMSQQSKLIQTKVLADQTKVSEQCNGWRGEEEKEEVNKQTMMIAFRLNRNANQIKPLNFYTRIYCSITVC
jgi:hypothetical protein